MAGDDANPRVIDGPMIRPWHVLLLFLALPAGMVLGSMVGETALPLPVRAGAGFAAWLLPLAGMALLHRWARRLDEFQKQIFWQSVGWAGIWTVTYVVGMSFYTVLVNEYSPVGLIGGSPGLCAFAAALMIMLLERKARRATAGARE